MKPKAKLSFPLLLMMISFASVNAVLFTPALPQVADFFAISADSAQLTITGFLFGYAGGQLIYGPLANRFGRKTALYCGITLQLFSCLLCVLSGYLHYFPLLMLGRFLLALGSAVGLKMTYTLVNETYEPQLASRKISYLMTAFAMTPGLSIALGGFLTEHYGWASCFYACLLYGLLLLFSLRSLPETQTTRDYDALKIRHLLHAYGQQFQNSQLLLGGLLMGLSTCFVYLFAALAPFIAINLFGMSSTHYGLANILPPVGIILGSLFSAKRATRVPLHLNIRLGIYITIFGTCLMMIALYYQLPVMLLLFIPLLVIYFGLSLILANASSLALSQVSDKAHGSAVMSFINMGSATLAVLSLGIMPLQTDTLTNFFIFLCLVMLLTYRTLLAGRTREAKLEEA